MRQGGSIGARAGEAEEQRNEEDDGCKKDTIRVCMLRFCTNGLPHTFLPALHARLRLLREVFEGDFIATGETPVDGAAQVFSAFAEGKGNNRANDDAEHTADGNPFQEHTVSKKCHR